MLRRIPGRSQRERHGEGGARETEHTAQDQRGGETVDANEPGGNEPRDHGDLGADTDPLGLVVIDQDSQHDP